MTIKLALQKGSTVTGPYLACAVAESVSIIDARSDAVISTVENTSLCHNGTISAIAFEDNIIGSVDVNKKLILWEVGVGKTEEKNVTLTPVNSTMVRKNAVTLHFHHMFGTKVFVCGMSNGEIGAFPAVPPGESDNKMKTLYKTLVNHSCSMITSVSFSNNGDFLLSGDRDEQVRVTNFPNTHLIHFLPWPYIIYHVCSSCPA